MNENWQNEIVIAKEASLLGSPDSPHFRPPGIRGLYLSPEVLRRLETKDIFRRVKENIIQAQAWSFTLSRHFALDAFSDLWLDAVADGLGTTDGDTTTRTAKSDRPPVTYTADIWGQGIESPVRLSGITLRRLELIIQSGRLIEEETEWAALRADPLDPEDISAAVEQPPQRPMAALKSSMALATGSGPWTPTSYHRDTFSGQILLERDVEPVMYGEDGLPTRYAIDGPFQCLGRATCAPSLGNLYALMEEAVECRILWTFAPEDGQRLEIELPSAVAKLTGTNIIADGSTEYPFDWLARSKGLGTFITRRLDVAP